MVPSPYYRKVINCNWTDVMIARHVFSARWTLSTWHAIPVMWRQRVKICIRCRVLKFVVGLLLGMCYVGSWSCLTQCCLESAVFIVVLFCEMSLHRWIQKYLATRESVTSPHDLYINFCSAININNVITIDLFILTLLITLWDKKVPPKIKEKGKLKRCTFGVIYV